MHFKKTEIPGVTLFEPTPHVDSRGRFMRAWCLQEFSENGIDFVPIQANLGFSIQKGTLRGLHFQGADAPEAKLIRCTRGAMFDVALDLRPDSPTYKKWFGVELSAENGNMLYIPPLCAHGYQTLRDDTEMFYMASAIYTPSAASGVRYDSPAFGIEWPLSPTAMSDQDRSWQLIEN
jgi:dTDP-4-dehydrorhamnose 3,5-epimerase